MDQWVNQVYQWTLRHPAYYAVLSLLATLVTLAGVFWVWLRWFASGYWTSIRLWAKKLANPGSVPLPPPAFVSLPDQSHCAILNDGTKLITQIRTVWHVTNRSPEPLRLLTARLLTPRIIDSSAHCTVYTWPPIGRGGRIDPFLANAPVAFGSMRQCDIRFSVHRVLKRGGKRLTVVFGVTDQFNIEHRLKPLRLWVQIAKTKVFRVRHFAGASESRTPQTPVKTVTVYLPNAIRPNDLSPVEQARILADKLVGLEVLNDPLFRDQSHYEIETAEADLSEYGKADLELPSGEKAWRK